MSSFDRSVPPQPSAIPPLRLPRVERERLENGLELLTVAHGRMPIVTLEAVLDAGAAADPPGRAGIARLLSRALDTGTRNRSAADIAWELEFQGIEFSAEATWDALLVRMTVARARLEPALDLLAELLRAPSFPDEELERVRAEQLAEISQRAKDPRALASDRAAACTFASHVPYARPIIGTAATVAASTRADVVAHYAARVRPGGASLILVGDVDAATARAMAEKAFGSWQGTAPPVVRFDVAPAVADTTTFVFDRPDSVQSEIRIGHVGVERSHPDYFPLLVLNEVLGGAFTSRLNMSLRERLGFTYGATSVFAFRREPGPFQIQTAVASDVTARAVVETVRQVRELIDAGATAEETAAARDFLTGVLPLQFQTTEQIASRLAELAIYGLPDEYFQHYQEGIAAVTPDDVQRVARTHLHPDRLAIVVVGAAADVRAPLEETGLGAVHVLEADTSVALESE